ncbi:dihydrofolate reductase [Athalassotoga saccharophila]|uniref:dihydrofolate reductase n=1 Tax=Athalassotoga saccharophila TaxID=1441386 RepID=UPI00137A7D0D|nr:dihydrofolate reductase family protein [Athalassotoga saccharophila]BBJ28410.1 dihydrofolate reductase [Athalassotoga saccharophila]
MQVVIIAVLSANGKIARFGSSKIDWNSKDDLEWFKRKTKEIGIVVCGRKTFETFNGPLKDRINIVMTHNPKKNGPENLIYTSDQPDQIIHFAEKLGYTRLAVIGGREVFTLFMNFVDELYLTYEPIFIDGMDLFDVSKDIKLNLVNIEMLGEDFVVHYRVQK